MKRMQLILETWQHEWLAQEAKKSGVSMSALVRQMLTEGIERRQNEGLDEDPLWGVIGLGEGPEDGVTSENLDEFLYNIDWRPKRAELPRVAEPGPTYEA
ncbi:MAG: hypothetical protein GXP42_14180 [Chloroflexi bacterium]|nr:hypothetical protein [Chloroflexota bacterium]